MAAQNYDCIVVGLGAMGSSAAFHLAKNNRKVLGIEQFSCAHSKGSSHGETRLIRKAYFEHPDYVPLLESSYTLWRELEQRQKKQLLHLTGLVIFGDPESSQVLQGVQSSARKYQIPVEVWKSENISKKFPQANVPRSFVGLYEPTGGYLEVENCVREYCKAALEMGAELHFDEKLIAWEKNGSGYQVRTHQGVYLADKIVLTGGAWMGQLLNPVRHYLKVHRAPLFWFHGGGNFKKENGVPCFAFDLPEGFFYGFTESQDCIKIALHQPLAEVMDPTQEDRDVMPEEGKAVMNFISRFLKDVPPVPEKKDLCFYTMSPDSHFILDEVPNHVGAFFAAGFSGHGFKFSSLMGKVLSDWVIDGTTKHPVDFLKLSRFQAHSYGKY